MFLFLGSVVNAQQLPLNNQYLINPYSLSPAYAGINGGVESFMTYRQYWLGVPGATRVEMLNINGPIGNKYGIGAELMSEQTGIFKSFSLLTTFAYHLDISPKSSLSFGIKSGVIRNRIDFTNANTQDMSDPFFANNDDLSLFTFETGFGALYRYDKLNIGFSVPRLLENQMMNSNNDVVYTLRNHSVIHAFYSFSLNGNMELAPYFVLRSTANSMIFDGALMFKYKGKLWAAPTYRGDGTMSFSFGGALYEKVAMNYSYEFGGSGMAGRSSGTHEISLGLQIGKKNLKPNSPTIFRTTAAQPYHEWIEE